MKSQREVRQVGRKKPSAAELLAISGSNGTGQDEWPMS